MTGPGVICLGMNEESLVTIEALLEAGANIRAIAGWPSDVPTTASDYVDLSIVAHENNIAWVPVIDVNTTDVVSTFAEIDAQVLFVLGWSQLLRRNVIDLFSSGIVGSHPTALPYGRGRAPIPWTVLEDLRESAVSLFRLGEGVDDGAILKQIRFTIPERATARIVYNLVAHTLARGFVELYSELRTGEFSSDSQDDALATWRARRSPGDGWIDFRWSAEAIDRLVRAVSEPYPGAYSYIYGERAVFWASRPARQEDLRRKGLPGQVLSRWEGMILVQAGDMPLWLAEPENLANSTIRVRVGERFGFRIEDELHALRNRLAALERQAAEEKQ